MVFSSKGCVLLRVFICSKGSRGAYLVAPPTDKYLRMCEQRHTNTKTLLVLRNLLEMVELRVRITCISFLCKHEITLIKIDWIPDYIPAKQIKNAMWSVLIFSDLSRDWERSCDTTCPGHFDTFTLHY